MFHLGLSPTLCSIEKTKTNLSKIICHMRQARSVNTRTTRMFFLTTKHKLLLLTEATAWGKYNRENIH